MTLPKCFLLHESRILKDSLDAIAFQFDRLDLDSNNTKIFLDRFLRISKSSTLPQDDPEVLYLAAKIAYMLTDYNFFLSDQFSNLNSNAAGAMIWYALSKAAMGDVINAIKMLEHVKEQAAISNDNLLLIESLGILAQLYYIRGSIDKEKLKKCLIEIDNFKEKYQNKLLSFDHLYMPAYLIKSRIISQQLPPTKIIEHITKIYEMAKNYEDFYWTTHFELDLAVAYLENNDPKNAEQILAKAFVTLKTIKFSALEAKAIRIQGQIYEKLNDLSQAEIFYIKAKELYGKLQDQIGIVKCITMLAELALNQKDLEKAEKYYNESHQLANKISNSFELANSLTALAKIAITKFQFVQSLELFKKALVIAQDNGFEHLLPPIYEGLAYTNFISGDFESAANSRSNALSCKEKLNYDSQEILKEHMRLGQLYAIIGNLEKAFNEFEQSLNYCTKLGKKDDLYFYILNWLFEISTSLGKLALAESYMNRADLFASIHNSEEENVKALISRIRFLIQKKDLSKAESNLEIVFEKSQEFTTSLATALALVEKALVLLLFYQNKPEDGFIDEAIHTIEDMIFISLDLEFVPLTIYGKRALINALSFKEKYKESLEELKEGIDLAKELQMTKFVDVLKYELDNLNLILKEKNNLSQEELQAKKESFLQQTMYLLQQTFWLVSASEHQQI